MIRLNTNLNLSHFNKNFSELHSELKDLRKLKNVEFILNRPTKNNRGKRKRNFYWQLARKEYENFIVYVPELTVPLYNPTNIKEVDEKILGLAYAKNLDYRNLELLRKYNYGRDDRIRNEIIRGWTVYAESYVNDVRDSMSFYLGERGKERWAMFIQNLTRFDKPYMKKQVRKFKEMRKLLELNKSVIFLTLTLDPKYHKTMKDADEYLREKKNLLITRIKTKRPVKKARKFSYLSYYDQADKGIRPEYNENYFRYIYTTETQTENMFNLHYHFMMSFNPPDNSYDVNEKIWSYFDHWVKSMWDYKWGINDKHKVGTVRVELVQEKKSLKTGEPYSLVRYYEHGILHIERYEGSLEYYLLKYLYKGFAYEDGDLTVNANNVRLWVANARTFGGTRVYNWRKKNNLPPPRDLIVPIKNNSKKFDLEENTELEITWHYGGRFSAYEIGTLKGKYREENLDASVLERIYRRMASILDAG